MLTDVIDISQTIPKMVEGAIERLNLIQTINLLFSKNIDVVSVEGDEGSGKSVLLRQFCGAYPKNTFSLFVGNANSLSYDLLNMRFDLCNQIYWFLNGQQLNIDMEIDDAFLRKNIFKLIRVAKRRKETFYFVIDGINDSSKDGYDNILSLFDSLPIGQENIKFLVSSNSDGVLNDRFTNIKIKTFPVPMFSLYEVEVYFYGLIEDKEFIEDVYKITAGVPSHLDAIRRLVGSGITVECLKDDMPEHLSDIFEIEWKRVGELGTDIDLPLSILAYDDCRHTACDIAVLTGKKEDDISTSLKKLSFINIDPESGYLTYISDGFKRFATKQLGRYKANAIDLVIKNMYDKKDDPKSLSALPDYLNSAERFDDLLDVVSSDHLKKLLKATSTLASLRAQADIGISAALKTRRDGDLFRLSYLRSVVSELGVSEDKKYEIEAYVSTSRYEAAIELASSAALIEDRLYLLSVTARALISNGKAIESTLKDQIERYFNSINADAIDPDKALEIAGELFSVFPDYAISLLEASVKSEGGENSLDLALARLSIRTIENKGVDKVDSGQLSTLSSRIDNKTLKSYLTTANAVLSETGFVNIINEVNKLEKTGDKLFMIKNMIDQMPNLEDSYNIIEYALKLAITTTDYSPNAGLYRTLSQAIQKIPSEDKRNVLIGYIDSQQKAIKDIGPTGEYIRLQLNIAEAEALLNKNKALQRVINIYLDDISDVQDIVIKSSCLAWLMAALVKVDPLKEFEKHEGIFSIVESELQDNISSILNLTAEQFHAIKEVICAVSPVCIKYAEEISDSLNIISRRDKAYLEILDSIVLNKKLSDNINAVIRIVGKIVDLNDRSSAVFTIMDNIDEDILLDKTTGIFEKIFEYVNDVPSAEERFYLNIIAYNKISPSNKECLETIGINAGAFWSEIPDGLEKVSITFRCVSILAEKHPDLANKYMLLADEIKKDSVVSSENESLILNLTVTLLLRSYRCLIDSGLDTELDFTIVKKAIQQLDNVFDRVKMWSRISCYFYLKGDEKRCKDIVFEYVKTSIDSIGESSKGLIFNSLVHASPVIWVSHRETFYDLIKAVPKYVSDLAYYRIYRFILVGDIPGDPIGEITQCKHEVKYTDFLDIIELMRKVEEDSQIYEIIKSMVSVIVKKSKEAKLSRPQVEDISSKLNDAINCVLPSPNYIKHDGFKISSLAEIKRLDKHNKKWSGLIKEADIIPNLADRIIVYSFICSAMPQKLLKDKKALISKAKQLVENIPDLYDQIDRYETLAECALDFDKMLSVELLKKAFSIAVSSNDDELKGKRKRLIDMAYKYDPDLPASLASLANDDPATKRISSGIDKRVEHLKLRANISDERKNDIDYKTKKIEGLPEAAWDRLRLLFAGRISPVHFDRIKQLMTNAALFPLSEAYPVYSYAIENARLMYKGTGQSKVYFRSIFEAATQATDILLEILSHNAGCRSASILTNSNTSDNKNFVVNIGERDKGLLYVKNWLLSIEELAEITICDPYFGPSELEFLKIVLEINPFCKATILTSEQHQKNGDIKKPWDEEYKTYWRRELSEQDPLDTEIIICGIKPNGNMPIHDRWIITDKSGLRLGTSLNSLGKKVSEISMMDENETALAYESIEPYITKREKMHASNRISYQSFDLY